MPENKVQIIFEAWDKTKKAFKSLTNRFKTMAKETGSFKLKLTELEDGLKNFANTVVGVAALYKLERQMKKAIDTAEAYENTLRALAVQARYSGEDIGASMQAATDLSADGLIDMEAAAKSLQNLLQRGFSLEESIKMMERFKDAAAFNRQGQLSMAEAIKGATEGLKNENSILVDNAGVTKNVSMMWKEYAAQIGKGANSLSLAEKRQAEFNGIMVETEGMVGNATRALEGITGIKAQLNKQSIELNASLGQSLTPTFLALGKTIKWLVDNVLKAFLGGIEITGARMGLWASKIAAIINWLPNAFKKGRKRLKDELDQLNKEFDKQAEEIIAKYEGSFNVPDIGKDTGKRRKDPVIEDAKAKKKAEEEAARAAKKRAEEVLKARKWLSDELNKLTLDEFDLERQKAKEIFQKQAERLGWTEDLNEAYSLKLQEIDKKEADTRIAEAKRLADEREAILKKQIKDEEDALKKTKELETEKKQDRINALEQIRNFSEGYHLFRMEQLDDIVDKMREVGIEEVEIERWKTEELKKLNREQWEFRLEHAENLGDALQARFHIMADDAENKFKAMADVIGDAFDTLENTLSDVFFDAMQGKLEGLMDYVNAFLSSIQRAIANTLGQQLTQSIMMGFVTQGTGTSPYFTEQQGAYGPINRHSGGYIPRFHFGGLNSDERPVIAKVGERFITAEQNDWLTRMANSGKPNVNVAVNIENQTGQPVDAQASQPQFDGENFVVGVVLKNLKRNGPIRKAIRKSL